MLVAWIWSAIWYVLLDPIKWALCWILNEDGFKDREAHLVASNAAKAKLSKAVVSEIKGRVGWSTESPGILTFLEEYIGRNTNMYHKIL